MKNNPTRSNIFFRRMPFDWIFSFIIGGSFLWSAIRSWNEEVPLANLQEGWWIILSVLIFMAFAISVQKSFTKSWTDAASLPGSDVPKDEREWRLFERASSYSLTAMYFMVWGMAVLFFFLPPPKGIALPYLLFSLVTFQLGFRGFIGWILGIR